MNPIQEWEERFDARNALYTGESGLGYWEERASDFSEMRASRDWEYGRSILSVLSPHLPGAADMLDIGAGPGSLLVPFAPRLGRYTAVEPAEAMIAELKRNASAEGVTDYEILASTWEETDIKALARAYDLVMISITLWMFRDVESQLLRMETCSRGICCVATGVGPEPGAHGMSLWGRVVGDAPQPDYSEFPFIFNLLYSLGRRPEVRIIDHKAQRSVETRIRQQKLFYSKYTTLTPEREQLIEDHVRAQAQDGQVTENYTSAIVWWRPL